MKTLNKGNFASNLLKRGDFVRGTRLVALVGMLLLAVAALGVPAALADSIGTYDQCSNDKGSGYAPIPPGDCQWINGNLNKNNSIYVEGDATVQRLWLDGLTPGSVHTVTFKYGTTKGGKHAYDFLTTWDWSESWIVAADRCEGITGCASATDSAFPIPQDPNALGYDSAARNFTIRGGTITAATTPAITSGSYAGDSETIITVTFTVAASGAMCTGGGSPTCGIAVWFGAHVASQANWGLGNGAGSVSGSPYHVSLDKLDGAAVGQRDNQMQADAVAEIPNGTIVVIKQVLTPTGTSAQDFTFNIHNNPQTITQNFSLDDDADGTLPDRQTFSVPPGTWVVTETNVPGGWTLTGLSCTPGGSASVVIPTATITLASSATVTCTYQNTPNTPTASRLDSFKGVASAKHVKLKWTTAQELDVRGFNVVRSTKRNGTFTPLNSAIILAQHSGSVEGGKYVYKDNTALAGVKYFYKVEIMGAKDKLEESDVVRVKKPSAK